MMEHFRQSSSILTWQNSTYYIFKWFLTHFCKTIIFDKGLMMWNANLVFFSNKKKVKKMPLKTILDNIELKIFFITQPWQATFTISLRWFSLGTLTNHFCKFKLNPVILIKISITDVWHHAKYASAIHLQYIRKS